MSNYYEEQIKRDPWLWEMYKKLPPRKPKPKTAVVTELDGKIAEAARANPESVSVRVTAKTEEGIAVLDRPRRGNVVDVIEVDNGGLSSVGSMKWTQPTPAISTSGGGAAHSYNPLDALKGD